MHRIYKRKEFVVYETEYGYIVQNILMDEFAHTHVNDRNDAIRLVWLSIGKKIPTRLNPYLLTSLKRINRDKTFLERIDARLEKRQQKQQYYNVNNGVRK